MFGMGRRNQAAGSQRIWDWEIDRERARLEREAEREMARERERERLRMMNAERHWHGVRDDLRDWDRGEGSSSMGATRRSTGVGGSHVR